jgi:hypothetical protein
MGHNDEVSKIKEKEGLQVKYHHNHQHWKNSPFWATGSFRRFCQTCLRWDIRFSQRWILQH